MKAKVKIEYSAVRGLFADIELLPENKKEKNYLESKLTSWGFKGVIRPYTSTIKISVLAESGIGKR